MSKLGLVVLLLAQLLTILQAMAHESEAQAPLLPELNLYPLEHKTQSVQLHDQKNDEVANHPQGSATESSSEEDGESKAAEAPQIRIKHHSTDKSVAGGGVIIGGLFTAIFAAVFAYIRVTRKRVSDSVVSVAHIV